MSCRSGRVVVVAHCILNANAKVGGGASYLGANLAAIQPYLSDGVGMVQLPCPESTFLGMSRFGMTRNQYDTGAYRRHCTDILRPAVESLEEFSKAGYELEAVVGIEGSPSCGVSETSEGHAGGRIEMRPTSHRALGRGVMMQVLAEMLAERQLAVPFVGVSDPA